MTSTFLSSCRTWAIPATLHARPEDRLWANAEGAQPGDGDHQAACGINFQTVMRQWCFSKIILSIPPNQGPVILRQCHCYRCKYFICFLVCWGRKNLRAIPLSCSLHGFLLRYMNTELVLLFSVCLGLVSVLKLYDLNPFPCLRLVRVNCICNSLITTFTHTVF